MNFDIPRAKLRTDEPAPSRTAPQDMQFFRDNPHRLQRLRRPTWLEMKRARKKAVVTPLKPGHEFAVLVTRTGGPILTALVRLIDDGEPWPDTDDDIDGLFGRGPVAPAGKVPA